MIEDLDIFDWNLTQSEMATLTAVAPYKPTPHPRPSPVPPGSKDGRLGLVAIAVVLVSMVVAVVLARRRRRGGEEKLLQQHLDSNLERGLDGNRTLRSSVAGSE